MAAAFPAAQLPASMDRPSVALAEVAVLVAVVAQAQPQVLARALVPVLARVLLLVLETQVPKP